MHNPTSELFIDELNQVTGGAQAKQSEPSSGPGGNLLIHEGGGGSPWAQPTPPNGGSSGPGGNLLIHEDLGGSPWGNQNEL